MAIKDKAQKDLETASTLHEVDAVWREYLGRKGALTQELRKLKGLSEEQRKTKGAELNKIKKELDQLFDERRAQIKETEYEAGLVTDRIDVTHPGKRNIEGSLHPITKTIYELQDIFAGMGFEVATGPQIETEWYNFDALNIPKDHPARDLWDTLWLKPKSKNLLLRTHTSPVQLRYMQNNKPPIRIIAPGRVFRNEATDASHEAQFYQIEGLMVDDEINVANFRAIIAEALSKFFKKEISTRLRPSYFPFVEPGFEVDITCITCGGKGCSVCSQTGWLELMGAGMVHPNVLDAAGYNPKSLQGFAFGIGIDRLTMMKYKIDDIRLFYGGDLRFLKQFK